MPQWHKDYFELKTCKNQQLQEEAFWNSPYLPKSKASQKNTAVSNPLREGSFAIRED